LVTTMFTTVCSWVWGMDAMRPPSVCSVAGAQLLSAESVCAAIACRDRFRSPVTAETRARRVKGGIGASGSSTTMPLTRLPRA